MRQKMNYNYAKLLGRIKERGLTQEQLAKAIGKDKSTLNGKIKGRSAFTTKEIDDICKVLDISATDIGKYFFAR
jgi:transcriptional regulator with XRE-family HTH domain